MVAQTPSRTLTGALADNTEGHRRSVIPASSAPVRQRAQAPGKLLVVLKRVDTAAVPRAHLGHISERPSSRFGILVLFAVLPSIRLVRSAASPLCSAGLAPGSRICGGRRIKGRLRALSEHYLK